MSAPVLLRYGLELTHDLPTALPLQLLHKIAHRQMGRHRNKQMNVVGGNMSFNDFHILLLAYHPYQFSDTMGDLAYKNLLPIFGYPHNVVFQVIKAVRGLSVILHPPKLSNSSLRLKARDFLPFPV